MIPVDLPVVSRGTGTSVHLNLCLLLCLLFSFPPGGIAFGIYWLVTARRERRRPGKAPLPWPETGTAR